MEYISKKELLEKTGISYGQLYRWKRLGLIPESWFIKRSSVTGQETVLPRKKAEKRIEEIICLMEKYSLERIAEKFSFNREKEVITFENLYGSPYLKTEYVNAVGNYFKKRGYTACEYMMIICAADVVQKEHFTTRRYVDLLRRALPIAQKCESTELRCVFFAAGGDCHLLITENTSTQTFDRGLRIIGSYNFETMWEKLKADN